MLYYPPRLGCEALRSACLYVCLYVCLSARIYKKQHVQTSPNFLCMVSVVLARTSSNDSIVFRYCLCVRDVMFSHNRANGPESDNMYISLSLPGGGTGGGEVGVYDCSLVFFTAIVATKFE